jgi:hypothetical protein
LLTARPEEPATIIPDQTILDAFEQYSFSFIPELARFTCIPTAIVHRHLTQSLGLVVKHLLWVPDPLTPTQKRSMPLSQLSSCASSGPSTPWLAVHYHPLTNHGSIFLQTMSRSGFA